MKLLPAFGPKIGVIELSDSATQSLYELCLEPNESRPGITGYVKNEFNLYPQVLECDGFKEVYQAVKDYVYNVDGGIYRDILRDVHIDKPITCTASWFIDQGIGGDEWKPPHSHWFGGDIVCVTYPKVELDETAIAENIGGKESQLGRIHFMYGSQDNNDFGITRLNYRPKTGTGVIFPASLIHFSEPMWGNSVRYSLNFNFKFSNILKKLLQDSYD